MIPGWSKAKSRALTVGVGDLGHKFAHFRPGPGNVRVAVCSKCGDKMAVWREDGGFRADGSMLGETCRGPKSLVKSIMRKAGRR